MADLDVLLNVLQDSVIAADEVVAKLKISRPTLSRLVAKAQGQVVRVGAARATRYARTRQVRGLRDRLPVTLITEGGAPRPAGELLCLRAGRHLWVDAEGRQQLFEGLPPFVADMSPQGFLGRTFTRVHADLGLPTRLVDWSDDDRLRALALRGDDCPSNLLIGEGALDRWLNRSQTQVSATDYPDLARRSAEEEVGSSAGGEQPKFAVFSEGRHVLVKFTSHQAGEVAQRWRDLLIAECVALQTLRDLQIPAAQARWFDADGFTFLEVDRFDRVGARGRRGVLSLWALDHEFYGRGHDWRALADAMQSDRRLSGAEAARVRWLDVFGALIGNSDRHLGNLSVFAEGAAHQCTLAPVYDMLPMHFAPAQLQLPRREYVVTAPRAETWSVWADAARAALTFWQRLSNERALSDDFRALATASGEALATAQQRFGFLS